MFEKVLLIANPASGKNKALVIAHRLSYLLIHEYASHVEIRATQQEGDAKEWAKVAGEEGFSAVICLGGDGTVNETVQGLVQSNLRPYFSFIPLGTVNDLGRAFNFSMDPDLAVRQFRNVQVDTMDIATVNGKVFINVVALGSIPESVMHTDSADKNLLGFFAYVKEGIGGFFDWRGYSLTIETREKIFEEVDTNLVLIGLTSSISGYEQVIPHADYNDGFMHMILIKGRSPLDTLKEVFDGGLVKANVNDAAILISSDYFKITNNSSRNARINVDGDPGPELPVELEILNDKLQVIIPAKDDKGIFQRFSPTFLRGDQ